MSFVKLGLDLGRPDSDFHNGVMSSCCTAHPGALAGKAEVKQK